MVQPIYEIAELGNPVLQTPAEPVSDFADPLIARHADAMFRLMEERQGVGIAAPQVGIGLQMLIVASRPNARYPNAPEMEPLLLVNPVIEWVSDDENKDWEGCLSVPGIRGLVTRPESVKIACQALDGSPLSLEWTGFPARIFLHEFDHLIGKTFIDRVSSSQDLYTEKEYQRIVS